MSLLVVAAGAGCERAKSTDRADAVASNVVASSAAPPPSASAAPIKPLKSDRADRTHRAGRCGECHEKMYDEWVDSAHAKSNDSAFYRALRERSGASCDRCHAPLTLLQEPAAFADAEGVSCEVCHRIEDVKPGEHSAELVLLKAHEVKYGPRCDPSEPYFHRARCLPLFRKSELCAGCHQLTQPAPGGGEPLPVHTEYSDFKKSVYAARGKACQSCHMPGVRAELATGERERAGVPDHGFLGHGGKLRGTAIDATAAVSWTPETVTVRAQLKNARAGHAIPAGSPGRELSFAAIALDGSGAEVARDERSYARRLVDGSGKTVPFTAATQVGADTRLGAGETRRETLSVARPRVARLRLVVSFRSVEPSLAAVLGVAPPEPSVVIESVVELGAEARGSRSVKLKR